jgi:hypothetical protein
MVCELIQRLECQSTVIVVLAGFVAACEQRRVLSGVLNAMIVANMLTEMILALEAVVASVTTMGPRVSHASTDSRLDRLNLF